MKTEIDLRKELDLTEVQEHVRRLIAKDLPVRTVIKKREEAADEGDLRGIPDSVRDVRIVEIEQVDKRPYKASHVTHTQEIGIFRVLTLKRVGKNRYRLTFKID